jgi:hypothetical protein
MRAVPLAIGSRLAAIMFYPLKAATAVTMTVMALSMRDAIALQVQTKAA